MKCDHVRDVYVDDEQRPASDIGGVSGVWLYSIPYHEQMKGNGKQG